MSESHLVALLSCFTILAASLANAVADYAQSHREDQQVRRSRVGDDGGDLRHVQSKEPDAAERSNATSQTGGNTRQ